MNGLNYNNLMIGMLLAKDLPQQEQLTVGLAASQFPQNNMMGAVLLKPTIDGRVAAEAGKASAESARDNAQKEITEAISRLNGFFDPPGTAATLPLAVTNAETALRAARGKITDAITNLNEVVKPPASALTLDDAVANAVHAINEAITKLNSALIPPGNADKLADAVTNAVNALTAALLPTTIALQVPHSLEPTEVKLSVDGGKPVIWDQKLVPPVITANTSGDVAILSFVTDKDQRGSARLGAKVDGVEEVVTVTFNLPVIPPQG